MPKVLVSIPEEELKQIDEFAKKEYLSRSQVFLKGAMILVSPIAERLNPIEQNKAMTSMETDEEVVQFEKEIRAMKPLGKCEMNFCKSPAVGRFYYKIFDNSSGESTEKEQSLCESHRNMLKSETGEGEFNEV